ncbi:hypothetical protein CB1_000709012 [Camelus ferus]|nr:hypothetical protein CB1_000709012 [Camelus ferus]
MSALIACCADMKVDPLVSDGPPNTMRPLQGSGQSALRCPVGPRCFSNTQCHVVCDVCLAADWAARSDTFCLTVLGCCVTPRDTAQEDGVWRRTFHQRALLQSFSLARGGGSGDALRTCSARSAALQTTRLLITSSDTTAAMSSELGIHL